MIQEKKWKKYFHFLGKLDVFVLMRCMVETREAFKTRLKDQGQWNEFLELRDQYKQQGCEPKVAYAMAMEKFPPGQPPVVGDGSSDPAECGAVWLEQFAGKEKVSSLAIVEWVFDNIDMLDVTPGMAPCAGAWSLLLRVRKHPDLLKEFYRSIWVRILPSKTAIEQLQRFEDDGREQLTLIDRIQQAHADAVLSSGSEGLCSESEVSP